ncbi:hypothetical protein TNCV_166151 [Trichonephila clavipes]|nr:hypothetical protein TNCV_166151 [Trichonephila clavipes]
MGLDRDLRISSQQRARCMHVVSPSFEHNTGDSSIWLDFTPVLKENTLEVVRGLTPLHTFHQLHERTCGLTAI